MSTHVFTCLDHAVDEVHALFDGWAASGAFEPVLDAEGVDVLRLAVHEWVANLVQHASFPGDPRITLEVTPVADGVRCAITDASDGFDFLGTVQRQQAVLQTPAPSERGRGLLMLLRCAVDLDFEAAGDGVQQHIAFTVRPPDAEIMAPLFRPADLVPEAADLLDGQGDGLASPVPLPPSRDAR